MSNLMSLPEEILIGIIKQLDLRSIYNLYNTCRRTKHIISMFGVVKYCNMSLNTMASAHILKLPFFKDISPFIQELNISGVNNLNKTLLVPAVKKLKCLKCINVGYTNINIDDFLCVYQNCPTIIDVTVDFLFDKKKLVNLQVPNNVLLKCQDMFKDFKRVHFIGSQNNLIYNKIAPFVLQKVKNINLHYTITTVHKLVYKDFDSGSVSVSFDKLYIYFVNTQNFTIVSLHDRFFPDNITSYECIVITMSKSFISKVYCSQIFMQFFKNNFDIQPNPVTECKNIVIYHSLLFFWNNETTVFDDHFYEVLHTCLRTYVVHSLDSSKNELAPFKYDRFHMTYKDSSENKVNHNLYEPTFKRARMGQSNIVINYDNIFKEKEEINLSINFNSLKRNPITLSPTCNFLSKLTYLSLKGLVQYSGEFFNILFRCCSKLETFNYEDPAVSHIKSIARSIPISKSIKNIRLIGKRIDHKTLITFFSQCSNLENVHLIDSWKDNFEINDYSIMFQKCINLYCLYLYAPVSASIKTKQLQMLNKAKLKSQKHHISVKVTNEEDMDNVLQYDPFIDVFNLNVIKPIEIYLCCFI